MIYIKCCDCLNGIKTIPDNSIDMVLTSPPYDNIRKYNGYTFDFEGIAQQLFRVVKDGGVVVWVVGDGVIDGSESGTSFKQALYFKEIGFNIHDTMIYEKNTSTFPARVTGNRYTQIFEYMFVFSKGKPKTAHLICDKKNKWGGVTTWGVSHNRDKNDQLVKTDSKTTIREFSPRNNIWIYQVGRANNHGKGDVTTKNHPAVFPLQLAKDHILSWSNENDLVLDPFMGSGTTGVACKQLNRDCIGFDISEEYCNIAKERIDKCELNQ